jgi:hypothetical protein
MGVASTIAGLGSVALPADLASANFGSTATSGSGITQGEVSLANNKWHSYSIFPQAGTSIGAWRTAFADTWGGVYDTTDLITSQQADNTSAVDVRVTFANYGTSLNGWVSCPSDAIRTGSDPNETCYKQWLKVDLTNAGTFNATRQRSLVCHETGHTVGLKHSVIESGSGWSKDPAWHPTPLATCMVPSYVLNDPATGPIDAENRSIYLEPHDIGHLNSWY